MNTIKAYQLISRYTDYVDSVVQTRVIKFTKKITKKKYIYNSYGEPVDFDKIIIKKLLYLLSTMLSLSLIIIH
jgi:hypothetical protein